MSENVTSVSFYNKITGLFNGVKFSGLIEAVETNTPEGHTAVSGHHDHLSKCVDLKTGEVVEYQPPAPSSDHEWDDTAKRWGLNVATVKKNQARVSALMRIEQLELSQHCVVREVLLALTKSSPDLGARLQLIEDEINKLKEDL